MEKNTKTLKIQAPVALSVTGECAAQRLALGAPAAARVTDRGEGSAQVPQTFLYFSLFFLVF